MDVPLYSVLESVKLRRDVSRPPTDPPTHHPLRGYPWVPVGTRGYPWVPVGTRGYPWVPVGTRGFPPAPGWLRTALTNGKEWARTHSSREDRVAARGCRRSPFRGKVYHSPVGGATAPCSERTR